MKGIWTASMIVLLGALSVAGEAEQAAQLSTKATQAAKAAPAAEVETILSGLAMAETRAQKLAAVQKLAKLDESATPLLVDGYRAASDEARELILQALLGRRSEEVNALVLAEVQDAEGCSEGVIRAAGRLQMREATPALLAQYEKEEEDGRRNVILATLAQMRDGRALAVLGEASISEERLPRLLGVSGLQRLAMEAGEGRLGEEEALALCGCLKEILKGEKTPHETRLGVITAMGMTGDADLARRVGPLVGVIERDIRLRAIQALGKMRAREQSWRLVEALEDSEALVRVAAVEALEKMGNRGSALDIVRLLDDPEALVRKRALRALRALTGKTLTGNREHWERWLESEEFEDEEAGALSYVKAARE